MKYVFTIVAVGLLAMPVMAEELSMTVTANVTSVWTISGQSLSYDFGELPTEDLTNDLYEDLPWIDLSTSAPENYLGFNIRTNEDYQVTLAGVSNLTTPYDNLGGGPSGPPNYSPLDNNAEIETEYKLVLSDYAWYDNGRQDGPGPGSGGSMAGFDWTPSADCNGIVLDAGTGINPVGDSADWTQYWTGGFTGTFKFYPKIKPIGLGQQPGAYTDTWTVTVVQATFGG